MAPRHATRLVWWLFGGPHEKRLAVCDTRDEAVALLRVFNEFAPMPKRHPYVIVGPLVRHTIRDPATNKVAGSIFFNYD